MKLHWKLRGSPNNQGHDEYHPDPAEDPSMYNDLVVISGTAHEEMAERITANLNVQLTRTELALGFDRPRASNGFHVAVPHDPFRRATPIRSPF